MKLYLLRPVKAWKPWYDSAFGFVVRAENEEDARRLCASEQGDEAGWGREKRPWEDPDLTTCVELTTDGQPEVIIRDFWAA